ncbi:MAG TPA: hypothetical protein VIK97_01120 [Casimicrobiaceae bacterium]
MLAERGPAGWRIFQSGADGKRLELNIAVPAGVDEDALGQYLDDLFHESATPAHPCVRRLRD